MNAALLVKWYCCIARRLYCTSALYCTVPVLLVAGSSGAMDHVTPVSGGRLPPLTLLPAPHPSPSPAFLPARPYPRRWRPPTLWPWRWCPHISHHTPRTPARPWPGGLPGSSQAARRGRHSMPGRSAACPASLPASPARPSRCRSSSSSSSSRGRSIGSSRSSSVRARCNSSVVAGRSTGAAWWPGGAPGKGGGGVLSRGYPFGHSTGGTPPQPSPPAACHLVLQGGWGSQHPDCNKYAAVGRVCWMDGCVDGWGAAGEGPQAGGRRGGLSCGCSRAGCGLAGDDAGAAGGEAEAASPCFHGEAAEPGQGAWLG